MIEASAQARAKDAEAAGATIKNSKDEFVLAARVQATFELPLARTFAENFLDSHKQEFVMPSTSLTEDNL
jgi:hypothetical protein